jgi:hypothetical protein
LSWFRFYDEVADDPKVQRLPLLLFRAWVNLMCLAKRNGGVLPGIPEIAYGLRVTQIRAEYFVSELRKAELIDQRDDGLSEMHNWPKRQFQSDVSTDRVRSFRQRHKAVSGNADETFHETHQNRTEQKQNRKEKKPATPDSRRLPFREFIAKKLTEHGIDPTLTDKSDWVQVEALLTKTRDNEAFTLEKLQEYFVTFMESPKEFDRDQGHPVRFFCTNISRFIRRNAPMKMAATPKAVC